MNGVLMAFKDAATEMELHAVAALRSPLSPEERDLANALLRHARGILALIEKWRILE